MDLRLEEAARVVRRLRDAGFDAFLVGGCVRDLVMGREAKDYDVATSATPAQVLEIYPHGLTIGAQFGVVALVLPAGIVEVATFRSDGNYADGRHPEEVQYARSAREDVSRRDFTINGLLLDPLMPTIEAGLLDYVGGCADIERRVVRTIGKPEERFAEDRLRMLRAVRFAARFRFELDPAAAEAIRRLAPAIKEVSAERIRDEIVKILIEGEARRGFELLDGTGLLAQVLPEVKAMQGVKQPPEFHPEGDVWTHTLLMLESMRAPTPTLALGVLLHDVGKPPTFSIRDRIRFDEHERVGTVMTEDLLRRLRFSNQQTGQVMALVSNHMRFKDFPRMRRSTQLRFLRLEDFGEHLELHRLDCLSSHADLTNYEMARRIMEETPQEKVKPRPLVNGDDLIALGYQPGPEFKVMLQAVEDAQLEGTIGSREAGLELIKQRFPL